MKKKKFTLFRPRVRSRHPSHSVIRPKNKALPLMPFRSVIRLGSTTEIVNSNFIELNTVESIRNSSNKLRMKSRFTENEIKTADWWMAKRTPDGYVFANPVTVVSTELEDLSFPIIAKKFYGSRNKGNTKIDDIDSLISYLDSVNLNRVLFEKYYSYAREYRLHVSEAGCFYACRKVLKSDAPIEDRWYRNDAHCNWIREDSDNQVLYDKPINWDEVVSESVKALKAVGLDFGAIDLRIQSAKNRDGSINQSPKFIIVEINSAPSFGDVTAEKYIEELPKILRRKQSTINN